MTRTEISVNVHLLKNLRIYFGHQSVGGNIMNGLEKLAAESELELNIVHIDTIDSLPDVYFGHGKIGQNEQPLTKFEDFRKIVGDILQKNVDIAMMKLCYIDINENTDVDQLFTEYINSVQDLKKRLPALTVVHVTSPLRETPDDISVKLRELLGRKNRNKLANIKRNEFNELMRREFSDEPVFDLAGIESTYENGQRTFFSYQGKQYYSLNKKFTYDGGHLNEYGSRKAAIHLLNVLSEVAVKKDQLGQTRING